MDSNGSSNQAVSTNHRGHQFYHAEASKSAYSAGDSSARGLRNKKAATSFQPRGTVEFPLKFSEDGNLVVQPNAVRTSLSCNVPGDRWNAKFSGASLIRGPMGSATGSMLLSYDVVSSRKLQAVSQVAVGDQANMMMGAIHHTTTAWYGVGIFYYPNSSFSKYGPKNAFQIQSQQRLENGNNLTIKFFVPTNTRQPNTTLSFQHKATSGQLELGMTRSQPHVTVSISPKLSKYRQLWLSFQWRQRKGIKVDASLNQSLASGNKSNTNNNHGRSSSIGIGVRHNSQLGLSWLFTWIRGDVVIKIPIFILTNTDPLRYLCSCYLAFTSYLIQEVLADIWNLKPSDEELMKASLRSNLSDHRAKARDDAAKQKFLMQKQAESRRATEAKKSGLVITKAVYYHSVLGGGGGEKWDVTTQLQFWTVKSSLDLPASSKQNLLGFYNVSQQPSSIGSSPFGNKTNGGPWWHVWKHLNTAIGNDTRKTKSSSRLDRKIPKGPLLSVQYDYNGESFEITIKDEDPLSLPSNKARKIAPSSSNTTKPTRKAE